MQTITLALPGRDQAVTLNVGAGGTDQIDVAEAITRLFGHGHPTPIIEQAARDLSVGHDSTKAVTILSENTGLVARVK